MRLLLALATAAALSGALAAAPDEKAQTVVHMLDYISGDYPNFVRDGQVLNQSEYAEQLEFAAQATALLLALLGWLILKYSVRLPIGPFFSATSGLLALLAVVFAGNGVAALQEAGVIDSSLVRFVSLPLLGVHPTAQGLSLQLAVLALVVAGVLVSRRKALAH